MSVKVRLTRTGANRDNNFRVVATDTRNPRDGRFIELLGWYEELLECPLHTHEEVFFDVVDILVKIDNVTIVVGNELRDFCNDSLLVRAMEQ